MMTKIVIKEWWFQNTHDLAGNGSKVNSTYAFENEMNQQQWGERRSCRCSTSFLLENKWGKGYKFQCEIFILEFRCIKTVIRK